MSGTIPGGRSTRAGVAIDYFGMRYGDIAAQLTMELESTTSEHQNEAKITWRWITNHNAHNNTFLGDLAVRLAVAK